jgi:hypothetical protein
MKRMFVVGRSAKTHFHASCAQRGMRVNKTIINKKKDERQ